MFVKNLDLKPRGPRCRGMTCEIERKLSSGYRPPRFGADLPNDEATFNCVPIWSFSALGKARVA